MNYKFTVNKIPVTKKNHSQIVYNKTNKRYFLIPSASYKDYEKTALETLRLQALEQELATPIEEPCEVRCIFYMPTRRRVDLTNLLGAIDDVLVKCGVLADDNCKVLVSHDGSRVKYDKEKPRTEITITEVEE